jgi:hypothetical protein
MAKWHQKRVADLALRASGLCTLTLGWFVGLGLYHDIHAQRLHQATLGELGRCAILVVSVLAGNALLLVGARLWMRVQVPGRRSFGLPDAASFELSPKHHLAGGTNDNGLSTPTMGLRLGNATGGPRRSWR